MQRQAKALVALSNSEIYDAEMLTMDERHGRFFSSTSIDTVVFSS